MKTFQQFMEVSPPGWGHTKGPDQGGSAEAFDKARKEGRFKGSKEDMFAIMWANHKKGYKTHYKPKSNPPKKKDKQLKHLTFILKEVTILKKDVVKNDIPSKQLTTDCHFVTKICGGIDIVRGVSMVKLFDYYHDKGIKITSIEVSGGQLNPKMQEPTLDK